MLKEQSKEEIKSVIVDAVSTALDEVLDELFKSLLFLAEDAKEETPAMKQRRTANELRDIIMKCWNRGEGEKTAYQISKETGININTVKKYIPMSKEG